MTEPASILSGDHLVGETVLGHKNGICSGSSVADWSLPLPEREIDPEELARSATTSRIADSSFPSAP